LSHVLGIRAKADESLIGFVYRLAVRRNLRTGISVFREAGILNPTNRPREPDLQRLADVALLPVAELASISFGPPDSALQWLYRGRSLPAAMFKGHMAFRKICPGCLAESPYHRSIWDLACISACPEHQCMLVNNCPKCGEVIRWRGVDLTLCGACEDGNLTKAPLREVPATSLAATMGVHGLLDDERYAGDADRLRCRPPFVDMAPEHIVEFLWRLGLGVVGTRPKFFSVEHPGEADLIAHVALQAALDATDNWPDGFYLALEQTRQQWGPSAENVPARLVSAINRWLSSLPPGSGRELQRALFAMRVDN
jgi:hypothetical protein